MWLAVETLVSQFSFIPPNRADDAQARCCDGPILAPSVSSADGRCRRNPSFERSAASMLILHTRLPYAQRRLSLHCRAAYGGDLTRTRHDDPAVNSRRKQKQVGQR
jgi:hypothetical protein